MCFAAKPLAFLYYKVMSSWEKTTFLWSCFISLSRTWHRVCIFPGSYINPILDQTWYERLVFWVFQVQEFGVCEVRDLKPNGANILVTEENKKEYVHLVCQMRMTGRGTVPWLFVAHMGRGQASLISQIIVFSLPLCQPQIPCTESKHLTKKYFPSSTLYRGPETVLGEVRQADHSPS